MSSESLNRGYELGAGLAPADPPIDLPLDALDVWDLMRRLVPDEVLARLES